MDYTSDEIEIRQTQDFASWLTGLRDREARARILARIRRVSLGTLGDVRAVGGGVLELRIHHGPGYRLYLVRGGATLVILLAGGDKRTQSSDIAKARRLARSLEE